MNAPEIVYVNEKNKINQNLNLVVWILHKQLILYQKYG